MIHELAACSTLPADRGLDWSSPRLSSTVPFKIFESFFGRKTSFVWKRLEIRIWAYQEWLAIYTTLLRRIVKSSESDTFILIISRLPTPPNAMALRSTRAPDYNFCCLLPLPLQNVINFGETSPTAWKQSRIVHCCWFCTWLTFIAPVTNHSLRHTYSTWVTPIPKFRSRTIVFDWRTHTHTHALDLFCGLFVGCCRSHTGKWHLRIKIQLINSDNAWRMDRLVAVIQHIRIFGIYLGFGSCATIYDCHWSLFDCVFCVCADFYRLFAENNRDVISWPFVDFTKTGQTME